MLLSTICFHECDCILGDLWLPVCPWSLYNSNCVRIWMPLACHFPRNNLLYACWDLRRLTVTANPSLFALHVQFHVYLCVCTQLKPCNSRWQLNISFPCSKVNGSVCDRHIFGCGWKTKSKCVFQWAYWEPIWIWTNFELENIRI